jgi:putative ABC transport system permease protein
MNRMILANLVHRPMRSIISMIAIAVEVTLILVIVGFSLGMLNDSKQRQQGIGADVMVQPPGASALMGVSTAPISIKVADVLRKMPHVTVVSPVVIQLSTTGNVEVLSGIDLATYEKLGTPFHYLEGGPFQQPDDVLVDDFAAASQNLRVGSTLTILNHQFRVCGIVEHGKGSRKFVQIQTLQDLIGAQGKASIFYVKLDSPANADLVVREILSTPGMQQYTVRSMREYLSMLTPESLPGLNKFIAVVVGVSMVIGFIVIFQAMYTAVMERTREIGILKSLGASKLYIVNLILRETMLLAVFGTILGIVVSYLASHAIVAKFRTLPVVIQTNWVIYAIIIAVVGALLGALYPAFKAAQKDPIDALAYE